MTTRAGTPMSQVRGRRRMLRTVMRPHPSRPVARSGRVDGCRQRRAARGRRERRSSARLTWRDVGHSASAGAAVDEPGGNGMLSPYRVVDCTDHRGNLAGFLLAQLGADVVLVEPPDGSSTRRQGPYAGDRPGPDSSLWHWAYNRGKRSVVLDRATEAGRHDVRRLLAGADILLWSGPAAELPGSYAELARDNAGLIVVAYTPFGL